MRELCRCEVAEGRVYRGVGSTCILQVELCGEFDVGAEDTVAAQGLWEGGIVFVVHFAEAAEAMGATEGQEGNVQLWVAPTYRRILRSGSANE